MTTRERIAPILHETYGKGQMVDSLAYHLADLIEAWPAIEGSIYRTREETIAQACWNCFSGGGTAKRVAAKIEAALEAKP